MRFCSSSSSSFITLNKKELRAVFVCKITIFIHFNSKIIFIFLLTAFSFNLKMLWLLLKWKINLICHHLSFRTIISSFTYSVEEKFIVFIKESVFALLNFSFQDCVCNKPQKKSIFHVSTSCHIYDDFGLHFFEDAIFLFL